MRIHKAFFQPAHRSLPDVLFRDVDRGQRRLNVVSDRQIVKTNDRYVLRIIVRVDILGPEPKTLLFAAGLDAAGQFRKIPRRKRRASRSAPGRQLQGKAAA